VADSQGRFTSFRLNEAGRHIRIRAKDFIHLTEDGGRIMAQKFLAETADWADYRVKPPVDPRPPALNPAVPPLPPSIRPLSPRPEATGEVLDENDFLEPAPESRPETAEPAPAPSAGDNGEEDPAGPAALWSEHSFHAPALGRATTCRLVLPRAGPGRPGPFPVIFLLHGAWDGPEAWERELGRPALLSLADRLGVILALPDGGPFGWYLDGRETAGETFLTVDFLAEVRRLAAADPGRLAVAGLSMGGHGALTLALKHPDLFQAAAALSAVTDLAAHAGGRRRVDPELAIDRVLGPAGPEGRNWRPFGAAGLWAARPAAWGDRPLLLGVGRNDRLTLDENRAFHRQLVRLGVPHVYRERPGGHDWNYWSVELPGLLEFLARNLNRTGAK
jgi:S-formylglutathione hydrolase FrmB